MKAQTRTPQTKPPVFDYNSEIKEARRYMQNAKTLLSEKAGKKGDMYSDAKYVRMAGDVAWKGVLIALDALLQVKANLASGQRPDFREYTFAAAKIDKNINKRIVTAYELLHRTLGYDGILLYSTVQDALTQGDIVITWCETKLKAKYPN